MMPNMEEAAPRCGGRPRLSSPERRARIKASKKAWADRNRDYVKAQIKALGSRPEYLERRRCHYRARILRAAEAAHPDGELSGLSALDTEDGPP